MRAKRALTVRVASLGGALALAVAGLAAMGVATATSASAATVTENFAGYGGAGLPIYSQVSLTPNVTQPASVKPNGTYTMNVAASSQVVPSTSGTFTVDSIGHIQTIIPVPAGASFAGGLSTGLQWSFTLGASTTHGTYTVVYCTAPTASCTAASHSSTFLGPTPTDYIETSTGTTTFAANGTLNLPSWNANFTATGAPGTNIQATIGEFDTTANLSLPLTVALVGYPSVVFTGTPGTPPAYMYQPLATTQISVPAGQISAVLPNSGPEGGGSTVTIHGLYLGGPTGVMFGSTRATSFTGLTANSVSAVAPPGVGTVDVRVLTSAGESSIVPGDHFTYTNGPIVTRVSPNTANPAGGTPVTITGLQLNGATAVDFGSTPATNFTVNSATSITATAPAGTGVVNVTVTGPGACALVKGEASPKICLARTPGVVPPSIVSINSALDQFNYRAGYWLTAGDGGVFAYGNAPFEGSAGSLTLNKPVVGMAATPDNGGYWLVASDGGVFSYGDAAFYGSTGSLTLNQPIVGMAATPDGYGYWLVAADGGVFSFGDAQFFGSHGGSPLNKPVVGIASTPDGGGYWLVASDGGVFSYGDAAFHGSTGSLTLNKPVVGIASTPDGGGYWLGASDGGVFNFGDAGFFGSHGGSPLNAPVVGIASSPDGGGYWLGASDGGVFAYPDATFYGSAGGTHLNQPMVGLAAAG
jgi:hypothetical protein